MIGYCEPCVSAPKADKREILLTLFTKHNPMPRRNLKILFFTMLISLTCYLRTTRNRYAPTIADAIGCVADYYIEPVERRSLYEGAMKGIVGGLDEHSGYVGPDHYKELQEELDQEFGGVGIQVGLDPNTNRLMVLSPIVDSPGFMSGLRAGDLILDIDDTSTEGMDLNASVTHMRGRPGTKVHLIIQPFGTTEQRDVFVERAIIQISSVLGDTRNPDGTWNFVLEDHPDIAYLRVVNFGEATGKELNATLKPLLGNVSGLILDLRGNPGGLLSAAVEVCDLFVDEGSIVSIRRRAGFGRPREKTASARDAVITEVYEATGGNTTVPTDLPIVVLIDKYSASASEIVAACLQDHGRAQIVGQRSWGKGTVQNVFELEGGRSALKLTTATYWRPSGTNIHRFSTDTDEDVWGVRPDDGYEIVLSDEEIIRRFRIRRERDFISEVRPVARNLPDTDDPGAEDATAETPSAETPDEQLETSGRDDTTNDERSLQDVQLERAVEYIKSRSAGAARIAA